MPRFKGLTPSSSLESEFGASPSSSTTTSSSSITTLVSSPSFPISTAKEEEEDDTSSCYCDCCCRRNSIGGDCSSCCCDDEDETSHLINRKRKSLTSSSSQQKQQQQQQQQKRLLSFYQTCQNISSSCSSSCRQFQGFRSIRQNSETQSTSLSSLNFEEDCTAIHQHDLQRRWFHKTKEKDHHPRSRSRGGGRSRRRTNNVTATGSSSSSLYIVIRGACVGGLFSTALCLMVVYVSFIIQVSLTSSSSSSTYYETFCHTTSARGEGEGQPLLSKRSYYNNLLTLDCLWHGPITHFGETILNHFLLFPHPHRTTSTTSSITTQDEQPYYYNDYSCESPILCWLFFPSLQSTSSDNQQNVERFLMDDNDGNIDRIQHQQYSNHVKQSFVSFSFWKRPFRQLQRFFVNTNGNATMCHIHNTTTGSSSSRMRGSISSSSSSTMEKRQQRRRQQQPLNFAAHTFLWPFWSTKSNDNNMEERANAASSGSIKRNNNNNGTRSDTVLRMDASSSSSSVLAEPMDSIVVSTINAGPSKLVIAGQMIVEESECNIAQLDLATNEIDKNERIQLSLYNSYNGGEVYSLLANQSYIGPKKVVQNAVTALFPHDDEDDNDKLKDDTSTTTASSSSGNGADVANASEQNEPSPRDNDDYSVPEDEDNNAMMINTEAPSSTLVPSVPSSSSSSQSSEEEQTSFLGLRQGFLSSFRRQRSTANDDTSTTTTTSSSSSNNNKKKQLSPAQSDASSTSDVTSDGSSSIVGNPLMDDSSLPIYRYGRELIVVGAFDTTYRNSQVTYCSVGRWDGKMLNKVGEGLCNSALSKGMKITSAAFAGPNDVYVAGSFHTQVWNGDQREFVKIFNIAHFNAINQVWLPLPVGQLTCSWCVVTVLALAWDNKRKQLHVAGKFNAIDNRNVPAGLALYDYESGHLVAHPGGGLSLQNITEDGVGTALQMDQENGVLYVMGSYERLTTTQGYCKGLAALEVDTNRWTCLADLKHTVEPTGGGNMLLTPYGLMVAGKVQGDQTTWPNPDKPYTIALLTINKLERYGNITGHEFEWSWLPGFDGHDDPIHCLSNGYGDHEGTVFIGGDNFVAKWHYKEMKVPSSEVYTTTEEDAATEEQEQTMTSDGNPKGNNVNETSTSSSVLDGSNNNNGTVTVNNKGNTNNDVSGTSTASTSNNSPLNSRSSSGGGLVPNNVIGGGGTSNNNSNGKKKMVMQKVPVTETLSSAVRGSVMAISQLVPEDDSIKAAQQQAQMQPIDSSFDGSTTEDENGSGNDNNNPAAPFPVSNSAIGYYILAYSLALGTVLGMLLAILCNRNLDFFSRWFFVNKHNRNGTSDLQVRGISLDTLTYSAVENSTVAEACQRALRARFVDNPNLLTIINPAEIVVHGIIGEGTFGRVWSASWRSADVAVKEFVFAQAAVAGRSSQQQNIIDDIIGEASMMAMLRHPNVLQMFGCCLTSQAIWIVSELCSLGSLRQLLDDPDRITPNHLKLSLALQIAEGMTYLHTQNPPIIHRDLKSHNIFVHETFTHQTIQKNKKHKQKRSGGNSGNTKKKLSSPSKYGSGKKRRGTWNSSTTNADDDHHPDEDGNTTMTGASTTATTTNNNSSGAGGGSLTLSKKGSSRRAKNNTTSTTTKSMIVAKIGDWGTARAEKAGSRTMTHGVGTACWLAPEVIKYSRCSQLSDVFSFGIILWELATREEVYQGLETMQIIAKVANENLRPPVPPNCLWKELMVQCWHEDPTQRPSFETIVRELNVLLSRDRLSSLSSSESMSAGESQQPSSLVVTTTYPPNTSSNNNGVVANSNSGSGGVGGDEDNGTTS